MISYSKGKVAISDPATRHGLWQLSMKVEWKGFSVIPGIRFGRDHLEDVFFGSFGYLFTWFGQNSSIHANYRAHMCERYID